VPERTIIVKRKQVGERLNQHHRTVSMSAITDVSNTNFTDISGKTTERLIHAIPTLINPTKSVSK